MDIQILVLSHKDDLMTLLNRIRGCEGFKILVVAPRHIRFLNHTLPFVLLSRMGKQNGKQIALVTKNPHRTRLAVESDLPVFRSVKEAELTHWPSFEIGDFPRFSLDDENYLWANALPAEPPPAMKLIGKLAAALGLILVAMLLLSMIFPKVQVSYHPLLQEKKLDIPVEARSDANGVSAAGTVPLIIKTLTIEKDGAMPVGDRALQAVSSDLQTKLADDAAEEIEGLVAQQFGEDLIFIQDAVWLDQVDVLGQAREPVSDQLLMVVKLNFRVGLISKADLLMLGELVLTPEPKPGLEIVSEEMIYLLSDVSCESESCEMTLSITQPYYFVLQSEAAYRFLRARPSEAALEELALAVPEMTGLSAVFQPDWYPLMPFLPYQMTFTNLGVEVE